MYGRWGGLGLSLLGAALVAGAALWLTRLPTVEVVQPRRGPAVQAVYATGTVEPTVMLPIAARAMGRLVELAADEGASVRKDQVLARLESTELEHTLRDLEAREAYAQRELARISGLYQRQAVGLKDYDNAKTNHASAVQQRQAAVARLADTRLLAPADGRIIRRDGEVGQMIPANQAVFWLSCCAPLRVSAEVDEEDISGVQPGQKVLLRADAFPEQVFFGTVQGVTPKGDATTRSFRVRIALVGEPPLLIGMTVETNIILAERPDAWLIPTGALADGTVWLVEDGVLRRRPVTVGARSANQVEIIRGVAADSQVVITPQAKLAAGRKVQVINPAGVP